MEVSTSYPDLALANMLLHVWNHFIPWLEVPELPVYFNENVSCVNELVNQPAEDFPSDYTVSLKHVHPIQGD
ncbi:hypothetical protein [Noviherbaspirillum humi]|uniref:hypothetical protein n=1 Tax=Noviherbaspirillum humi TaxID=1688639 RepID=UPI0011602E06|nr:hypothetical protein [Noviherbaspirillum humi]